MTTQEKQSFLHATNEKLVHPLSEVRRRAVQSLDFKLKHRLISLEDVAKDRTVLKSLLGCLQYSDNGDPTDVAVLMLLAQAAAAAPVAARQLLHLGAEQVLGQLQHGREGEVQAAAGYAFSVILAVPKLPGSIPPTPALAPSAADTPWMHGHVPTLPSGSSRWLQHPAPAPAILPTPSTVGATPAGSPGRATLLPTHGPAPAFTYSPPRAERVPWSRRSPAGAMPGVGWSAAGDEAGGAPCTGLAAPPHAAAAGMARPPTTMSGRQGRHDASEAPPPSTAATAVRPRDWLLQPVALGQADDQDLFELSLRLKCMADPRVVLPALIQLHGCCLVDLPVEAVATRHGILDHLLAIVATAGSPPDLVAMAARCLLRVVVLLKRAMLLATDPMYANAAAAARGAAGGDTPADEEEEPPVRSAWASPPRSPERGLGLGTAFTTFMAGGEGLAQRRHQQAPAPALLPQPMPAAAAAAARGDDPPVNVTLLAHVMALQVFNALRDPQRLFTLAPLAEELLPLLLVGRDGTLPGAGEADRARWMQLLQALSRALVANISMARAESPPIVQAFARDGTVGPLPPVLNAPAAALLALAVQLLAALPRELWSAPGVVPAALTDAAAAVARDELLGALLPGARRALLPLLAVLRPDVGALLEVAAAGEAALAAGEAALRQLPALRAGELPPGAWLAQLRLTLPALHLPGQDGLLDGLVQGLALVCSSSEARGAIGGGEEGSSSSPGCPAAADWVQQAEAEEVFLSLLSHVSPAVAMACYSLLEGLLSEVRARPGHPLLRLLSRKAVLERQVVLGLSDERTRRQVARILLCALPDAAVQSCVQPWSFWIRLYEADPQVGALAASLEAGERSGAWGQESGPLALDWQRLQAPLLELYSSDVERRRAASRQLAERLQEAGAVPTALDEPHVADPFRVCLDNGARDDLVVPTANPRLARSFRPADVSNLLAILANGELALELRRSAAEQMLALAAEERLQEVLEEEASLRTITCVASLRDPATGAALSTSQAGSLAGSTLAPPAPDVLSTLDVQLPLAAVNLLFVLAARSRRVRAWLLASQREERLAAGSQECAMAAVTALESGGPGSARGGGGGGSGGGGLEMLVGGVVPLVFHSMVTVRRAVARLLAALCFGAEADRWSGWAPLASGVAAATAATATPSASQGGAQTRHGGGGGGTAGTGSAGDVLLLPYSFQRRYSFPCRVTWVRLPPACQSSAEPAALEGKPRLQDLVAEQRHLVVLLIQERQALHAAGGDLGRLLALMNERPDCLGGLPPAALHTLAASIRAVVPGALVSRGLAAVRAATSHEECTVALKGLQLAASTRPGAAALAAADWQVHFDALLSNAPITPEDRALWVELLELLRRALVSGTTSQPQLLHLAEYLSNSALEVLSTPDAAVEPPCMPVALAGSSAATVGSAADLYPQPHSHLLCTMTVMATLVDLVRCARTRLSLQQALRVLVALSPAKLLHTLGVAFLDNPAASYGCRAAAVQLLLEVTTLLAAQAQAAAAGGGIAPTAAIAEVLSLESGLHEALLVCLKALLGNLGGFSAGGGAAAPKLSGVLGGGGPGLRSSIGSAAAVTAAAGSALSEGPRAGGGFTGKGAVRMALCCLLHLTALLPVREWAPEWQELSGSFWVSRLLRDRDAVLRSLAAEVLSRLLQPGATATQAMVAQGWPDAAKMMVKTAADASSCYALRTAALRVLCCYMTQEGKPTVAPATGVQAVHRSEDALVPLLQQQQQQPEEPSDMPRRQLFASLTSLPPSTMLLQQQESLWAALPRMLRDPGAPAPFTAAAVALLLQTALLDGERAAVLLQQPGLFDRLLQLLQPRPLASVGTTAAPVTPGRHQSTATVAAMAAAEAGSICGNGRGALLLVVLGTAAVSLSDSAPYAAGGSAAVGAEGDAGANAGVGFTTANPAAAAAALMPAVLAWASYETDAQLEVCAGLEMAGFRSRKEWAAAAAGAVLPAIDPTHYRQLFNSLRCGAMVAQLLAHALQDPPLLQLPPPPARPTATVAVAAAALGAFARLAAGVAAWDADRGAALAVQLVEGAVRLEAVRQAAAAANAALEFLDEEDLRDAVVPLNASLCRSSGPLLTRCAEVLLVGCSPRPLRLAVVCLLATLLSRQETAAALLRFEGTDNEHLVGSTGREVGAGLCAALIELLPDDALLPVGGAAAAPAPATHGSPHGQLHHVRASVVSEAGASASGAFLRPQQPAASRAGAGGGVTGNSDLRADSMCVIVALRNLLAYSNAAKMAALRAGYHRVLLLGCSRTAAMLTTVQAGPGGRGSSGDRHQSAHSSGPTLGTPKRGAVGAGAGRGGARRAASAAGRGTGAQRRAAPAGRAHMSPWQEAEVGPSVNADGAGAAAEPPEPPLLHSAASPAMRAKEPASSRRQDADLGRAAARMAAEQNVVASLSLLRHLAYGSAPARNLLVRDGAVAVLRTLWPAATTSTAVSTAGPLFHELLGCLTNLLPECAQARARMAHEAVGAAGAAGGAATEGGVSSSVTASSSGTLLGLLLALLFAGPRLEASTFRLAVGVLQQLASAEDGAALLLKSPFLGLCQKALEELASGATSGSMKAAGRDPARQVALLEVLTSLASWPEGQRALLRSSSGPGLLELVLRWITPVAEGSAAAFATHGSTAVGGSQADLRQPHPHLLELRNAALALVRNLCFSPEAKSYLLAHPSVLPSLVGAAEAVADNPQGAAYAASGVWALTYNGEKVKATIRRVPSAPQRLVAAYASCRFAKERLHAQHGAEMAQDKGSIRETLVANIGARVIANRMQGAHGQSPPKSKDPDWFLLASSQLSGLLAALHALNSNAHLPDWSPQRDQYA